MCDVTPDPRALGRGRVRSSVAVSVSVPTSVRSSLVAVGHLVSGLLVCCVCTLECVAVYRRAQCRHPTRDSEHNPSPFHNSRTLINFSAMCLRRSSHIQGSAHVSKVLFAKDFLIKLFFVLFPRLRVCEGAIGIKSRAI